MKLQEELLKQQDIHDQIESQTAENPQDDGAEGQII